MIYRKYNVFDLKDISSIINKIIFEVGYEREAMKILFNNETQTIYDSQNNNNFMDHYEMFQT